MVTHRDVGKFEPKAFCNGDEYAFVTDNWLHVTCPACHEKRHPQAPLSDDERLAGRRATGPGTSRPI